jgi:hypothetical protein
MEWVKKLAVWPTQKETYLLEMRFLPHLATYKLLAGWSKV